MKKNFTVIFLIFLSTNLWAYNPKMRQADKIRIREAINISQQFGEKIWTHITQVPFIVLLVTEEHEFLVNHPNPSEDFQLSEEDDFLKTSIYYRARQFAPNLLATFPAVNGLSCIVVGTPENTNKTSSEWIITLLHEHFHQYQNSLTGYFKSVDSLNLSGGDNSGMWMLNYPFPYTKMEVVAAYKPYTQTLYEAVKAIGQADFEQKYAYYKSAREEFKNRLSMLDYAYFSFQLWQEGLARHTEYLFLTLLDKYQPSTELAALSDFMPFVKLKDQTYEAELNKLQNLELDKAQRICFYSLGFAEGLLLDRINPSWRDSYWLEKFYIEKYRE